MTRALVLALILSVVAQPLEGQGQGSRWPRKWVAAGVGALAMGTVATVYALSFDQDIGSCAKASCVIPVSVLLGAGIGYMIGAEMDNLYAVRYGHAPPISLRGRELALAVTPNDVAIRDTTLLVTGSEGIEVIRAGPTLERLGFRARGLRGIGPVLTDDQRNLLLVGSSVGLYRFPLRGDEPGTLAHPGEISALSGDGSMIALGLGLGIQLARAGDSIVPAGPVMSVDARVMDLHWQGDTLLWVLTEDRLTGVARDADTLRALGSSAFPSLARRFSVGDSVALVAAGSGGVYAVDVRDPAHPRELANWSGARFVYDVAAIGDLVYIAAGPEGLYILRLTPDGFAPIGLSRGLGFVAAVEAGPGAVYLLDRTGAVLRRLDPQPN